MEATPSLYCALAQADVVSSAWQGAMEDWSVPGLIDDAAAQAFGESCMKWDARKVCTPCTLHPTPYTLHPTPYTLHPTPYTLNPTHYTLHFTLRTAHYTLPATHIATVLRDHTVGYGPSIKSQIALRR